ncbi:MAG: translation initiation factor IF-2 subunit beta [Candidatus Woesearchaeota archaeon]
MEIFDYKKMLEDAQEKIPEQIKKSERFEIPRVLGRFQGNKTVITNLGEIAQVLGRDTNHMIKYLTKSLAASIEVQGNLTVFGRKIKSDLINEKIAAYAKTYVICKECTRPDTILVRDDRILFLKCQACGAKQPIAERL